MLHDFKNRCRIFHFFFQATDNWKKLACHLGLTNHEIQYFDSHRFRNPADEVLKQWETKRNTTVGDLYNILVELDMPVIADSAL